MARAKDLAGLAALGFLGYKIFGPKGGDAMGPAATAEENKASDKRAEAQKDAVSGNRVTNESSYTGTTKNKSDAAKNIGFGGGDDSDKNLKRSITTTVKNPVIPKTEAKVDKETNATSVVPGGNEKRIEGRKPMPSLKAVEQKAAARQTSISTDAIKNASRSAARRANLSPIDQIPGQNRSGPTGGERVSGTEFSRNLSNTAAALTPLTGGASKVATEFALGNSAAKAATAEKLSPAGQRLKNMEEIRNVAMPGRRDAVMNPLAHAGGPKMMEKIAAQEGRAIEAEARAAAAQAARESKTLNPNAWLAGPKGMAENFRRGGSVSMTASRRGDGIASRGKTRGKIC
jgi:hypothetical protein